MNHSRIRPYFFFGLLLLIGALAFKILLPFIAPLACAISVTVIVNPLYVRIQRIIRIRSLSALVTVCITVFVIAFPFVFLGSQLTNEAKGLYTSLTNPDGTVLSSAVFTLRSQMDHVYPGAGSYLPNISSDLSLYAKQVVGWLVANSDTAFFKVGNVLLSFAIFLISLYYLLRDGARARKAVITLSPLSEEENTAIFERLSHAVSSVLKGNLTTAVVQGILSGIGYSIFGIPNPILWGSATALAALIPGVGTSLVFIPMIIYAFVTLPFIMAFGLTLWSVLLVGLIDNFLAPILVGKGMQLHPLLVFLSVVGGIILFGPVGILMGPLTFSFLFALLSIYSTIDKKNSELI
jgi:predicted PurR-regulated permease PerM